MTLKGFTDRLKSIAAGAVNYATVAPIREGQFGLDVKAHVFVQPIASDMAEGSSTTTVINATAHAALVGDVISWTSGNLDTKEYVVWSVTDDTITVSEAMSEAPATNDAFDVLRPKMPKVNGDGELTIAASLNQAENTGVAGSDTLRAVEAGRQRAIVPVSYSHAVPVTTAAYTEIIASTSAALTSLYVSDTSGRFIILALGAAAAEANQIILSPGFAGWIPLYVPIATRISIKALDANTAAGYFIISGLT